jgi:hypothetical protein
MIATGQAWNRQVDVIFVFAQLSQSDFDGIVARGTTRGRFSSIYCNEVVAMIQFDFYNARP